MADLKNDSEVLNDIRKIIEQGRHQAYAAAGQAAIATYWGIGRRIVEEEQHGDERAKYGTHLITELAAKLIPIFGNNYSKRNLQHYRKFYIRASGFTTDNSRLICVQFKLCTNSYTFE